MAAPKPLQVVAAGDAPTSGPKPEPVILYGLEEYVQSLVGYGSEPYAGGS